MVNVINIRECRYGCKPILKITDEELIFNELTGDNDWSKMCCDYIFTEDFMRKYKDKVDWQTIVIHHKLREKFIEEMFIYIKPYMGHLVYSTSKKFRKRHSKDFRAYFADQGIHN